MTILWILLTIGFVIVVAGAAVALTVPEVKTRAGLVIGGATLLYLIATIFFMFASIPAGYVGLVKQFGAYQGVKEAGAVMHWPWQSIEKARVRNASHEVRMDNTKGGANGGASSKESQEVYVVATLNYSLEKGCVQKLYTNYGASYYDTIIEPRVKQIFKAETVRYPAIEILPNREKIRRETQAELTTQLEPFCVRGLDFLLKNIGFGPEFTKAIEEKQVATQQAAAEQNRVQIAKQQAQQKIETARGAASATRIQANADAYAYAKRRQNLTDNLVEWERIQKWQPTVIYLPSDTIIGLPKAGR